MKNISKVKKTRLTPREKQCLALFIEGKSAKETGALLEISHRTVWYYTDNMRKRLNCASKKELLDLARTQMFHI